MCDLTKSLERKNNGVAVGQLSVKCRYHKKEDEKFNNDNFLKDFKCLELFHSLYPMVLALMYDANFTDDELVLSCPNSENTVAVRLFLEPVKGVHAWINRVKEMLRPLRPMDVVNSTVCAEVISIKGQCHVGCEVGDVLRVDLTGTMCPQALYSLFPAFLHADGCQTCTCPSHVNQVVFENSAN